MINFIVSATLFFISSILFLYLLRLCTWGMRVKPCKRNLEDLKFYVLIAAHNEEQFIVKLLESLRKCDYPSDKLKILFIADHCDDTTATIIRDHGFRVIERSNGRPGKAGALEDGFKIIKADLDKDNDVILIFDADNVISPSFFKCMSRCMTTSVHVAQANTGIHNKYQSLFTRLNYLNFAVTNRFKELARSQAGLTCRLRGHGMAFRPWLFEELSSESYGHVEDQEMLLRLVLKGERVIWVHDAHVDSIIPASAKAAAVQRKRWAGGKSELMAHATGKLFKRAVVIKSSVAFDLMVDYIMPSYAIQLGLIMFGLVLCALLLGLQHWMFYAYICLAFSFLMYYYIASVLERVSFLTFTTFVLSPFFIFWRVWIYFASLSGVKKWR